MRPSWLLMRHKWPEECTLTKQCFAYLLPFMPLLTTIEQFEINFSLKFVTLLLTWFYLSICFVSGYETLLWNGKKKTFIEVTKSFWSFAKQYRALISELKDQYEVRFQFLSFTTWCDLCKFDCRKVGMVDCSGMGWGNGRVEGERLLVKLDLDNFVLFSIITSLSAFECCGNKACGRLW